MVSTPTVYRGRFAPSPTGNLHLGSLVAALGSWLYARRAEGQWLVRIEDLDPPREIKGAAQRQLAALHALGLDADAPVLRQSKRHTRYQAALDQLLARGLAFECRCSRRDVAQVGGIHRRCVARAGTNRSPAIRLQVADATTITFNDGLRGLQTQDVSTQVGDFVLRRADGYWAYQLAVVVDDAAQGVTEVVRGGDLLDSTPRQILLQRALGVDTPRYVHLPLITNAQGRKLSKSHSAQPLDPTQPLKTLQAAWRVLGQPVFAVPSTATPTHWLQGAREVFDPARISLSDATTSLVDTRS